MGKQTKQNTQTTVDIPQPLILLEKIESAQKEIKRLEKKTTTIITAFIVIVAVTLVGVIVALFTIFIDYREANTQWEVASTKLQDTNDKTLSDVKQQFDLFKTKNPYLK